MNNLRIGFEPATSSLGIQTYVGSKSLARFCCEFLNLQRLAESAFSGFDRLNEAQTRHVPHTNGPNFHLDSARLNKTGKPSWPTRSLVPTLRHVFDLCVSCHILAPREPANSLRTKPHRLGQGIPPWACPPWPHTSSSHIQKWPAKTNSRQIQWQTTVDSKLDNPEIRNRHSRLETDTAGNLDNPGIRLASHGVGCDSRNVSMPL